MRTKLTDLAIELGLKIDKTKVDNKKLIHEYLTDTMDTINKYGELVDRDVPMPKAVDLVQRIARPFCLRKRLKELLEEV